MFCPKCGSEQLQGTTFCSDCGSELPEISNTVSDSKNTISSPNQTNINQVAQDPFTQLRNMPNLHNKQNIGMPMQNPNQMQNIPNIPMQYPNQKQIGLQKIPIGMQQMPNVGLEQMPYPNQMPNMGMQQMPYPNQMHNMGMQQMPNMGMQQMPNMGIQQMPNMGMQQMPNMGMQQMPNMGMQQMPNMGMQQMPNQHININIVQPPIKKKKKNKFLAGALALFFGGLGAHKFYLGKYGWGILYALFPFFSTLIALAVDSEVIFMLGFLPSFVSIIEALMYMFMANEDFQKKYS